jgi:protein-disulfide isomerase
MTARVQADMTNAQETGGGGTPWSILIGPSGKTYPINGALPLSAIEQLISVAKAEA